MGKTLTEPSEKSEALLERLKGGDRQALAELFSIHRERLWRTVHFRLDRRLQGRVDPDDVLQEAYLSAADRMERFVGDSSKSLYVWLRLILGQTLIDVHRRHLGAKMRDAGREVSIQRGRLPQTTSTSLAIQLAGNLTSPSQAAMREEMSRGLEQVLEEMDPIDREVLALRHFEELSNSEVAEVLGIQQKAASIRYIRAVRRLKVVMSQLPGFAGDDRKEPQA
ncbi:MAG: sigma-70 family RNA polymerase sigma factor [Planctomycetes bacterium]|nr:sigma-70 family RNA polymerase sigma factor [Planctomycetota bacterium]